MTIQTRRLTHPDPSFDPSFYSFQRLRFRAIEYWNGVLRHVLIDEALVGVDAGRRGLPETEHHTEGVDADDGFCPVDVHQVGPARVAVANALAPKARADEPIVVAAESHGGSPLHSSAGRLEVFVEAVADDPDRLVFHAAREGIFVPGQWRNVHRCGKFDNPDIIPAGWVVRVEARILVCRGDRDTRATL